MSNSGKKLGFWSAIALIATAAIGDAAAQSTIKIGVVQPLTGAFATAGTDVVNGAKIAVDESTPKVVFWGSPSNS